MLTMDRRQVLRLGVLGLALLGTSAGVAQLAAARPAPADEDADFDEVYKGRRIRGSARLRGSPRVLVDDVELHLMRSHPGGYTTVLNHYQSFRTARRAARAAVDSLNGARLLPVHP